ncbi:conserved Plasmodium protein, unknown function [Plasmodium berghei]|uniref:SCD domain-containing protein n=2 Tax=Plasmodium berghei TaxID=5821 RepID=A0A509ASA5_PLABA|nr:conserved Plasmodium protein, unknown function [Plasmodium berghei ANKA]SCL96712.1 conserved Plasmodium protein, unknown function [Plasmodium berghei]SCM16477.1 conserved Plasmodium protein, unknown function [Plasmodium berghei]SCM18271.1 conserved Plasmodium protein, unknown function [Plasmodium berghei]SCN27700.1 conserved Plasmodium protein, unknown function [Plasmodium berghei]VUC57583.1 conserved Plasmodium protein, unknown function [Plasmodium berghei ANKA]|eukprot:XP_034423354.1 conserved Plasmodium protein, unknown function [Plasmodium berghei ANKA]
MDNQTILRRSTRISQSFGPNKKINYFLSDESSEDSLVNKKKERKQKRSSNKTNSHSNSSDKNYSADENSYNVNESDKGEDDEDDIDKLSEDREEDERTQKKKRSKKNGKKKKRSESNESSKNKDKTIVLYKSSDEQNTENSSDNIAKAKKKNSRRSKDALNQANKTSKRTDEIKNGINSTPRVYVSKNVSYIDKLNVDMDDDDFDIFKKSSRLDKNKRISTSIIHRRLAEITSKKRKSVYIESSNSDKSSEESDDEYTNEKFKTSKKSKHNNNNNDNNNKLIISVNNKKKHIIKNFEDFNLYEKIKKNPKNFHEIIEDIYYSLFNREERDEKIKVPTFFLNFLAECSGNESVTWTMDIIDYIDKQVYLYEDGSGTDIGNNNIRGTLLLPSNNNGSAYSPRFNELIAPSTVRSCNKVTNIDEIIKDENSLEKICTFKCEKLEQYLNESLENDALIKSKNENNRSYKAFSKFFSDFAFHFEENHINDILYICIWVFSLNVSKYRKIRFTSSLASFSLLLGLCKKINYINNHEKQSRKQLLSEYIRERTTNNLINMDWDGKNGRRRNNTIVINDADIEELINFNDKSESSDVYRAILDRNLIISQLINDIKEDRQNLTMLNNFLLCTYNILYKNKIRDVFVDIRVLTLEYYYKYLEILTIYFTNRKFTKLLIWILYDKDSKIKIASLNILIYLCNYYNMNSNNNFKIVELIHLCKKKILNLIFDNDHNVRMKTFELILQMSKMKIDKQELQNFKKKSKGLNNNFTNKNEDKSDSSEESDMSNGKDNENGKDQNTSILSKREKKIVNNLIWFNNNEKISSIITSLIYESQLKSKIKENIKKKNNYFDVGQNETNTEIDKHNLACITKYLNKNIPTVKNFVHYFDYLTNYNENMKLYTLVNKFIKGIRDKIDSVSSIDIIIELLCESDISFMNYIKMTKKRNVNDKSNNQLKRTDRNGEAEEIGNDNKSNDIEDPSEESSSNSNTDKDLKKCLLHICESSYRNLQNDIMELEKNKNKKYFNSVSNSNNKLEENSFHNRKLNHDINMIKRMIIYTFNIIKNSKILIKMHQTNQEHLLLILKILKHALNECKHIYKSKEKNNIYNFTSTILEYFKNDINSNVNYFFNNSFIYLKETYEYLFYLLKNFKLPYYSSKYTINIISLFLSLNPFLKNDNNTLPVDLLFDLYYTYFNNFIDSFIYYRNNYNAEIECDEEEGYIQSKKNNKVAIVSENLVHKEKHIVESIENDIVINITNLIHIYTICFNYINNDLSNYHQKKNDAIKKKIDKDIKHVIEYDFFKFIVNEKCQAIFKDNVFLSDIFDENEMTYYDQYFLQADLNQREREIDEDQNDESEEKDEGDDDGYDDEGEEQTGKENEDNENDSDYDGEHTGSNKENRGKKKKLAKKKTKKNNLNNSNKNGRKNDINFDYNKKEMDKVGVNNKDANFPYKHNIHNLYYSPDACMHANAIIEICFYIIKTKINSIYYYDDENTLPNTPSSRLILLCIDQIYIIYENYIYHLCKKRYFFNYLYNFFLKNEENNDNKNDQKEGDGNIGNSNFHDKNEMDNGKNNKTKNEEEKKDDDGVDKNFDQDGKKKEETNVNMNDFKKLKNLNEKKINILKNIFIETNYIYDNIIALRDELNLLLILLIKYSNNTVLKYGTFLNLMNVAQLDNVLLYSANDLKKYKTLELVLNILNKEEAEKGVEVYDEMYYTNHVDTILNNIENGNEEGLYEFVEKYTNINEEINKYKNVSRYVYKEDNALFNFVTELFKNVENINNDNYNFVNSFLSIDIGVFFPINTYTYIVDMCKIYNKDELSNNTSILEMQYMHMTLIIAQFILNSNNINIYNSCLGVLLLIHLNVKNKGLSSIALTFHNKLKKYNINIFYEVLLCALIGLYTAYINNALEEKDLLLFSASIASRLGVKIVDKQKLPLCKFIHSCVNCALNLKNQNTFIKYILPYAQKLNLTEYQINYLKKQILGLIQSYNLSNNTNIKFENSIFEHMLLVIHKKKKLNDEFKDINYENSFINLNETIHMNIRKNLPNNSTTNLQDHIIKTRKSSQGASANTKHKETEKTTKLRNNNQQNDANDKKIDENIYKQGTKNIVLNENDEEKYTSDNENTSYGIHINDYINQNEDDEDSNVSIINKSNENSNKQINKHIYEIESSPKPKRTTKLTKLQSIMKKENGKTINNNEGKNIPINELPKESIDHSLNSSLNNNNAEDNDDISIISENKMKMNYFDEHEEDDDDSISDIMPGMSPMKMQKKGRSELSTPISYADDLMNF